MKNPKEHPRNEILQTHNLRLIDKISFLKCNAISPKTEKKRCCRSERVQLLPIRCGAVQRGQTKPHSTCDSMKPSKCYGAKSEFCNHINDTTAFHFVRPPFLYLISPVSSSMYARPSSRASCINSHSFLLFRYDVI